MKIGIVNDTPMAAEALQRALKLAPMHKVIWVAKDGFEAVDFCARNTPDMELMDLIMPGLDGVEAPRRIMASTPCTIMIVTASVDTNFPQVFEAMGHGALDAVDTPSLGTGDPVLGAGPFLAKIATIDRLIRDRSRQRAAPVVASGASSPGDALLAIGASAGGPGAVMQVLAALPRQFPASVVVVQHVDERFSAGLADWLNGHSALPVRLAKEGDRLQPGTVLLAGKGEHLTMKAADRVGYTPDPIDHVYRPSVDVFFESIRHHWSGRVVGVLLTGMGADGARGLKELRSEGHHTIAQDEATSAVYGMPKAAALLNAAVEIVPLPQIASRIVKSLEDDGGRRRSA